MEAENMNSIYILLIFLKKVLECSETVKEIEKQWSVK